MTSSKRESQSHGSANRSCRTTNTRSCATRSRRCNSSPLAVDALSVDRGNRVAGERTGKQMDARDELVAAAGGDSERPRGPGLQGCWGFGYPTPSHQSTRSVRISCAVRSAC